MMSNDIQKADQIAYRFYAKLCLVVHNARSTTDQRTPTKVDKWFNLETPDYDLYRDTLRIYRSISSSPPPVNAFELQVLLTVPDLSSNQVLVHLSPDHARLRIDPTPHHIVLESWLVHFSPSSHHHTTTTTPHTIGDHSDEHPGDVAPSTIYKHGIPLFRSLYSLLRILPTWKLCKRLRRRMSAPYRNGNLTIQLRIGGSDDGIGRILEFDDPPASNTSPLPYEKHTFPSIPHPMGMLSLSAKYLTSPNFQLDELESLLSSRFLSLDEASDFTPTLAKNQARDSMSGLTGPSTSLRTSLPKSPPSSIAGQFILPPPGHPGTHVRTQSLSSVVGSHSPKTGHVALPISRTTTTAGAGSSSGLSFASSRQEGSGTWSKEEGALPSLARLRRESMSATGRSTTDLPGALPIRKSGITPVHPFKSSTLSSGSPSIHSPSPSLRQPSPLSTGNIVPTLPSNPTHPTLLSLPSRVQTSPRVPPSPIGMGMSGKPSPPFAPSSLGDRDRRKSMTSTEGGVEPTPAGSFGVTGGAGSGVAAGASADANTSPSMTTNVSTSPSPRIGRGRYRSSFGHRYSPSGSGGGGVGAGVEGSTGSAGSGGAITSGGPAIEHDRVRELSREGGGKRDVSQEGVNRDAGSGGGNRERGRTTSFLAASTDDDELSMFVQEIDARKPLTSTTGRSVVGRVEGSSRGSPSSGLLPPRAGDGSGGGGHDDSSAGGGGGETDIGLGIGLTVGGSGAREKPERDSTDHRRSSSSISAGPMLTREAEVDEKLKHMNEMFLASLEGLGCGSGRRRSSEQVGVVSIGRDGDGASPGTGSSGVSVSGSGGVQRPRLRSMRSFSGGGGDVASSGGSAEVIGRLELDHHHEESRRRRWGE
ncbi:autophagy-related protein 13-domain-containing protein [Pisolithus albus]|nr:autophagy-related protein 13-domain-containing protein [Pisolithus albus]